MTDYMLYLWILLTVLFAIAEAATAQLVTVWFAVGSAVSLLLCALGVKSIAVQITVFVAVSFVALLATRPLAKRLIQKNKQPTNADRAIGQTGAVTQAVNNLNATGAVKINGNIWTARSENGELIPEGTIVTVLKIEGVKLIVTPADKIQF